LKRPCRRARLLLVDDEAGSAATPFQAPTGGRGALDVPTASDGDQGWAAAQEAAAPLVISDVDDAALQTAYELLRRLRLPDERLGRLRRVIFLTAKGHDGRFA